MGSVDVVLCGLLSSCAAFMGADFSHGFFAIWSLIVPFSAGVFKGNTAPF